MEAKDNNVARAVIGMDGKQSEVGESNGRSGKSLVGELMRNVVPTTYIPGKRPDLFTDQFVWNDVQENTKLVFIDDVLQNFNFEFLFPNITGDWTVNYKGGRRITIPFARSAKIYIATNHAIRGTGSSYTDRQWLLAFSDFYNDTHKPVDDFGTLFFSEWDFDQWNLTWNLLANCVQLYLTFGIIQAPGERLEQRKAPAGDRRNSYLLGRRIFLFTRSSQCPSSPEGSLGCFLQLRQCPAEIQYPYFLQEEVHYVLCLERFCFQSSKI
ncbi:hypothetical protein NXX53_11870 [Bacteroides salyersiae]|nr:hypothetical protein [Bacteroides salyersiae]